MRREELGGKGVGTYLSIGYRGSYLQSSCHAQDPAPVQNDGDGIREPLVSFRDLLPIVEGWFQPVMEGRVVDPYQIENGKWMML